MARRSSRISSSATSTPAHKRAASNTAIPQSATKRSKKIAAQLDDDSTGGDDATSHDEDGDSEYGDENDEDHDAEPSPSEESEVTSDEDVTPRKTASRRKITTNVRASTGKEGKGSELWRPGVKTGLGPGTQVIIKKPKARPAGKTPYSDETIHPNTFLFLKDLKANNDRQWLKLHDPDFRQSERDWFAFVDKITEKLVEIDDTIPELPVKDVIFRIYRDVRFSNDPTPYKPHFSAAWSRTGRKGPYAHYYVQIGPNESFVGGGLWHPDSAPTAAMRRDIDHNPRRLKDVLLEDRLRKEFLDAVSKTDKKTVSAFVSRNSQNALKTKPKGYSSDHPDLDLLRLRNYTIGRKLSESDVTGANGLQTIARLLSAMKPFITYLNSVVMPDAEGSGDDTASDSSSGEEDDDSSGESGRDGDSAD